MPRSREQLRYLLASEIHTLAEGIFDANVEKPIVVSAASDRHTIALKFAMRRRRNILQLQSATQVTQEQIREALAQTIYEILRKLFDADFEEPIVASVATDRHAVAVKFAMRRRRKAALAVVPAPSVEMSADMSGQEAPDMSGTSGLSPDMSGMSADMSGLSPDISDGKVHFAPDTPDILSPMQRDILEALSGDAMKAKEIAAEAGYKLNSYFRTSLSRLVHRGYLQCTRKGYVQISNHLRENVQSA